MTGKIQGAASCQISYISTRQCCSGLAVLINKLGFGGQNSLIIQGKTLGGSSAHNLMFLKGIWTKRLFEDLQ